MQEAEGLTKDSRMGSRMGSRVDSEEQAVSDTDAGLTISEEEAEALEKASFKGMVATVMNEAQYRILRGRTPREFVKQKPGRGGRFQEYVEHGYVTSVLNDAFGWEWDLNILDIEPGKKYLRVPAEPGVDTNRPRDEIVVCVELVVKIHDPEDKRTVIATIRKTDFGRAEVLKGQLIGDAMRSAVSTGMKRAAARLGVALDLYWKDSGEEYIPAEEAPKNLQELRKIVGNLNNVMRLTGMSMKEVAGDVEGAWRKWKRATGR